MFNQITLTGRLTAQPELRYLPNGTAVATFTLAVDRSRKDQAGNKVTDFILVQTWAKTAENCANYLDKGRLAIVTGELHIDRYEKDGEKKTATKVNASQVVFLPTHKANNESSNIGTDVTSQFDFNDDQIPF